jgi:hypothetical protein
MLDLKLSRDITMNNLKKISKANNVKNVDLIYEQISKELAEIDALQYVKIYNGRIKASNFMSTNGKKEPIINNGQDNIVGVDLLIDSQIKTVQFYYIASSLKGYGEKMVYSVINSIPEEWDVVVLLDWSHGFWPVMANKYPKLILA